MPATSVTDEDVHDIAAYLYTLKQVSTQKRTRLLLQRDETVMAIPNSVDILQAVIEATPDAIFVKDLEGRYLAVNAAAARFLGRRAEDIIGKLDLELYPEETARRFIADDQQVLAAGAPLEFEGVATGATGTQAYLVTKGVYRDTDGQVLGTFGISHDVTELRRANDALEQTREALFRSQKLELVGQLTGGLAHDFNNIVAVMQGNLELLRMHFAHDAHARDLIEPIIRAAAHAHELASNLLMFARKRQLHPKPRDINALIERMVRLLSRTLPPRMRVTTDLREEARLALVDAAAFEAALLNVVLNARDAMPEGGLVQVRTFRDAITSLPAGDSEPLPGPYAVVEVTDTGLGMTEEVSSRAFEPFFTTKAEKGGTGLGLSMVHGFAQQCGGLVSMASTPGQGTSLRIYLPLADRAVSQSIE
jgi:PAS domain S-box-containing protein